MGEKYQVLSGPRHKASITGLLPRLHPQRRRDFKIKAHKRKLKKAGHLVNKLNDFILLYELISH